MDQLTDLEVYKAILASAYKKSVEILVEYLGSNDKNITGGKWFSVAKALPKNAPWRVKNAVGYLCCWENFSTAIGKQRVGEALIYAFELGATSSYVELEADFPCGIYHAIKTYQARQKGSSKGGSKSKKLTLDQEELARKIISEEKRANVSHTAACTRAAAKLLKKHGLRVSSKTLQRLG